MQVRPLASTVSDNWMYLVVDGDDAVLVDPIDAPVAVAAVVEAGARSVRIVTTHGHHDHAGGNAEVVRLLREEHGLSCPVLAPARASNFPVPHDEGLNDEGELRIGATTWRTFHAPGHTDCHFVLYSPGHLVSGDVIFVAGVGNCRFGGDPGRLYDIVARKLPGLPADTVFYPGHDYAEKNLRFALELDPDNAAARAKAESVAGHTRADGPVLATLGEEQRYNPFFRVSDREFRDAVLARHPDLETECTDPGERAFRILRGLRDAF